MHRAIVQSEPDARDGSDSKQTKSQIRNNDAPHHVQKFRTYKRLYVACYDIVQCKNLIFMWLSITEGTRLV